MTVLPASATSPAPMKEYTLVDAKEVTLGDVAVPTVVTFGHTLGTF